jgi:hypothetical protein
MLDRHQDAITAMIASVAVLLKNPGMILVWASIIVVMTIIGHATWHAYRGIVEPLPVAD